MFYTNNTPDNIRQFTETLEFCNITADQLLPWNTDLLKYNASFKFMLYSFEKYFSYLPDTWNIR